MSAKVQAKTEGERNITDYMASAANAKVLADKVERWWADRGFQVNVEVTKTGREWVVRSDLLNGAPRARISNYTPPGNMHPNALLVGLIPMPRVVS